jgi:hypothetical protein
MESTVTKSEDCQAASFSHKCHHFLGFFLLVEISLHACARAAKKKKNFPSGGKKSQKTGEFVLFFFLLILHSWVSASLVLQLFFCLFTRTSLPSRLTLLTVWLYHPHPFFFASFLFDILDCADGNHSTMHRRSRRVTTHVSALVS